MIIRKSPVELEKMRKSGLLVYEILTRLAGMVKAGVNTHDLEGVAEKMGEDAGARPAFKGYYVQAARSHYPYVLCTSVNHEIIHGLPSPKRGLKNGDIVKIDTR